MTDEKTIIEGYENDYVRLVKEAVDSEGKLSLKDLIMYFRICESKNLDPLQKLIVPVKRKDKVTFQVSIDGFRLIAERTGRYAPGKQTEFLRDDKGKLIGATVFVKKLTSDGTWHEVSSTAFLEEYKPKFTNAFWSNMPSVMISKCAEAAALRRAFPDTFSGLYAEEEMDQAKEIPKEQQSVDKVVSVNPNVHKLETISAEQYKILEEAIEGHSVLRQNILNFMDKKWGLKSLSEMPLEIYEHSLNRAYEETALKEAKEA